MAIAPSQVGERNQALVKVIKMSVNANPIARLYHLLRSAHGLIFFQFLYTTRPTPFKVPQVTKFHDEPCHKPPSTMVSIRLMFVFTQRAATALLRIAIKPMPKMAPKPSVNQGSPTIKAMNTKKINTMVYEAIEPSLFPPSGMYR